MIFIAKNVQIIIFFLSPCFGEYLHFSTWINLNSEISQNLFIFETPIGLSVHDCIETCKVKKMCDYINYQIRTRVCSLIGTVTSVGFHNSNVEYNTERKRGYVFGSKQEWNMEHYTACDSCSSRGVCDREVPTPEQYSVCENSGCGPPEEKEMLLVQGNMFSIGDKIKYSCKDGSLTEDNGNETATCQATGNWTSAGFSCIPAPGTCYRTDCYLLVETPMTWYKAKNNCLDLGGKLLSVKTEDVWNFVITNVFANTSNDTGIWIGANAIDYHGVFRWQDATAVANGFKNWATGEPDYIYFTLGCVFVDTEYKWQARFCGNIYKSVCEFVR